MSCGEMHHISCVCSLPSGYPIPGVDFYFQNITNETQYFNFTIPAGSTRNFPLTIIDDSVAEYDSTYGYLLYNLGIYDSGQRLYCDYVRITIDDDDGRLH